MLLTTYGMVLHNSDDLGRGHRRSGTVDTRGGQDDDDDSCIWDIIFLDEVSIQPAST